MSETDHMTAMANNNKRHGSQQIMSSMPPLFAEAAGSVAGRTMSETESDESFAASPGDFENLTALAREQGDELEAIASRLAGLNFGRLGVVTRELECTRQQVYGLEKELQEASNSVRHLSVYASQSRQLADASDAARISAEGKVEALMRQKEAAAQEARMHVEKMYEAEGMVDQLQRRVETMKDRADKREAAAKTEMQEMLRQHKMLQSRLQAAEEEARHFRGSSEALQLQMRQMSSALAELEGRLKRSTEELQASEAQASRAREWHEARHAELLRSLSAAEQAASDAAAQAEAAAADKDEAVRAAEENLNAMQKEKVDMTRSLRSSARDVRMLLQKLEELRRDAAARQQAAADERRLLEQSLGQVEALEVQVKQHQQDVKKEALASRCLASELAVLREEYSKKSDEVSAYASLNRDLEEENQRLDAALEQGRRRVLALEALAGKVDQLQGEVRCLRGDEEELGRCDVSELMRYSTAITEALSKVNNAILAARMNDANEASQCSICITQPRDTALNCGHVFCNSCSQRFSHCPVCRAEVAQRTRLFV